MSPDVAASAARWSATSARSAAAAVASRAAIASAPASLIAASTSTSAVAVTLASGRRGGATRSRVKERLRCCRSQYWRSSRWC